MLGAGLPASSRIGVGSEPGSEPGIRLWMVWTIEALSRPGSPQISVKLREDAERSEARPAAAPKLLAGHLVEVVERLAQRFSQ